MLGILNMPSAESNERTPPGLVHVAILRDVKDGHEADFERHAQEFFRDAASQPGVCGAYLIRPVPGSHHHTYGILRTFRGEAEMQAFYASDLYARWQSAVRPLVDGEPRKRRLHGLEAFFAASTPAPPKWKMAIVTFIGVNIAVYTFSTAVSVALGELPMIAGLLLVNALVVASLTWVVMPLLMKLFNRWLISNSAKA